MGNQWALKFALGLALLLVTGCAKGAHFREDAFYHDTFPYRVMNAEAGALRPTEAWRIRNYQLGKHGEPLKPKRGGEVEFRFDTDNDGTFESKRRLPRYDVLLTHRNDDGQIWVRTVPLSAENSETDLAILARRFVEAVAGEGSLTVTLQDGASATAGARLATRVLDAHKGRLDDIEAYEVIFEIANVDQLKLDPNSRWQRVRLIFSRPDSFQYSVGRATYSVMILLGYENFPEAFAEGNKDFERLLGRVDLMSVQEQVILHKQELFACGDAAQRVIAVRARIDAHGHVLNAAVYKPGEAAPTVSSSQQFGCAEAALREVSFGPGAFGRTVSLNIDADATYPVATGFVRSASAPAQTPPTGPPTRQAPDHPPAPAASAAPAGVAPAPTAADSAAQPEGSPPPVGTAPIEPPPPSPGASGQPATEAGASETSDTQVTGTSDAQVTGDAP